MRSSFFVLGVSLGLMLGIVPSVLAVPTTGGNGPGGFVAQSPTSDMTLWLKGDAGVTTSGSDVLSWADQSGRSNNAIGDTLKPTYTANINGVPVLSFAAGEQKLIAGGATAATIIAVNRSNISNNLQGLIGQTPGDFGLRTSSSNWQANGNSGNFTGESGGAGSPLRGLMYINGTQSTTGAYTLGVPHMLVADRSNSSAHTFSQLGIGAYFTAFAGRDFQGEIGEIVIYNRLLNTAEQDIIENHLNAKYNIGLTSTDYYSGDAPGTDFDFDVIGIGRNNATSQVLNAGAAGFGMEAAGGASPGDLNDGEFIMAGHNNAVMGLVDVSSSPLLEGQRWTRIWNVDTNGNEVDATLGFNFDDAGLGGSFEANAGYQLLYSSDADFENFQILELGFSIDGSNTISFSVPSGLLQDGFYTLGIGVGLVPEPGSMLLLSGMLGCVLTARRRKQK